MRKWIVCFVGLFWVGCLSAEDQVHILCYHTFLGKPKVYTDFSIAEFRQQVQTIKSHGYRFVTLQEVLGKSVKGPKNVMLVLDDGNASAYRAYEDVLKPSGIKAVFAIYPGIINKVHYAMKWEQVVALKKDGNDIVSHGYFHEFLNDKLKTARPKDFDKEAVLSKKILESKVGISVVSYVYPFGVVTTSGKTLLKASGYRYAFSLVQKPMLLPIERNADLLDLPRYMVTRQNAKSIIGLLK